MRISFSVYSIQTVCTLGSTTAASFSYGAPIRDGSRDVDSAKSCELRLERRAFVVRSFAVRRLQSFHCKVPRVTNRTLAKRLIPIRNALIRDESLNQSAGTFPHARILYIIIMNTSTLFSLLSFQPLRWCFHAQEAQNPKVNN